AASRAAGAQQQGTVSRIALAVPVSPLDPANWKTQKHWAAFFEELRRLGHREGETLVVQWHSSDIESGRVPDLARQVVALKPDISFTPDSRMAGALKAPMTTIPVVTIAYNPLAFGLAASLARPGGNITGFTVEAGMELLGKRIALLKEAVPAVSRFAVL